MQTMVKRYRALGAALVVGLAGTAAAQPERGQSPGAPEVTQAVRTELLAAPRVSSQLIDIVTRDGVVTLTSSAPTLLDRQRAAEVVETVRGVRGVVNRIEVLNADRPDDEIRADIVRALAMDPAADAYELEVGVEDQTAHLSGTVESWHERELARKIASSVRGVREVAVDGVTVRYASARPDREILADVRSRLSWNRWIDARNIEASVRDGAVSLDGAVGSAQEKRQAAMMSWVSGVTAVDDSSLAVRPWTQLPNERSPEDVAELEDSDIAQAVRDALGDDPRVIAGDIKVRLDHGIATLSGVVGDLRAHNAAGQDARNTAGVVIVHNLIRVRPDVRMLDQDEMRERVLGVMDRDPIVWREGKYIRIEGGTVYLMGDARSLGEAERAVDIVSAVPGVVAVINNLRVSSNWEWKPDDQLVDDVESQLFWSPFVDSDDITVTCQDGVVTLTGEVDDWSEYASARENAWDADPKGVRLDLDLTGS